jgi:hypothetical protein
LSCGQQRQKKYGRKNKYSHGIMLAGEQPGLKKEWFDGSIFLKS